MPYTPNPTNAAEPLDSEAAGSAAAEFRALKGRVNTLAGTIPSQGNVLINGGFMLNQRGLGIINDTLYGHDQWYALVQAGSVAIGTLADVENGTPFMARLTQSHAIAQRIGYAQPIEGINCKHMRGKTVTFKINRLRVSIATNIRMAVLEWTGSEDAITKDVVLNWASSTYTAGNFFLASNLTVSGVVQQALTANTLTDGSAVTVTLGSSFNNLIVFVWTESEIAQNVTLDLGKAQLEIGSVVTPFEYLPLYMNFIQCERYYQYLTGITAQSYITAGSVFKIPVRYNTRMRVTPALNTWSGIVTNGSGAATFTNLTDTAVAVNITAVSSAMTGIDDGTLRLTSTL